MAKDQPLNMKKMIIVAVVTIVILSLAVYGSYYYSTNQSSNIILPGGVTYLGPSTTPVIESTKKIEPKKFTVNADVTWKTWKGRIYPFEFSYPETLPLVVFPNDQTDSVAIAWEDFDPRTNILVNMEFIDKRDPKMAGKPAVDFVQNWYKYFTGLKGLSTVEKITTITNLKGYKAKYINTNNETPNTDIFYEIPGKPNLLLRLANGVLAEDVFNRIVDSVRWNPPSPTTANK